MLGCIFELTWTSFPLCLTSVRSANDIDDAQDAGAGLLDRLEDGLLEMQDDSVDDSRGNTTDNAVGAAATDNDVMRQWVCTGCLSSSWQQ